MRLFGRETGAGRSAHGSAGLLGTDDGAGVAPLLVQRGILTNKRKPPLPEADVEGVDMAGVTGGAAAAAGVARDVDVHVGTLSKAFGSLGGFVACTTRMKQYLLTRGRAFVYSTALPVPVVAAAFAALQASLREPNIRERLWERVRQLGDALGRNLESPIVAVMVGDELTALQISQKLLRMGYHVPAIRPPTVPKGTSRLRIALSAAHTEQDVADLVRALQICGALEIAKQFKLKTRGEGSQAPGGALRVKPAARL
mmetsp:Transcript_6305/g.12022  ORF Transcript_6305/g.12022 Transcript_6305/m.12022 type:complete len:256 (+) Transcript_6305:787-1554(+)